MLLSLALLLPLAAAAVVLCIPAHLRSGIRLVTLVGAASTFGVASLLVLDHGKSLPGDTASVVFEAMIEGVLDQISTSREDPQRQDLQRVLRALPAAPSGKDLQLLSGRLTREGRTHLELYESALEFALAHKCPTARQVRQVVYVPWVSSLGISFFLGVDGLSLPWIWLVTLLGVVAVLYAWHLEDAKSFYLLLLVVLAGLVATFAALDAFLLVLAWELVLVPAYFLVGAGEGQRRAVAALKLILFTLLSGALLLLVLIAYHTTPPDIHTFNLLALTTLAGDGRSFPASFQTEAFLVLLVACAIRMPVVPLHTWFPDAMAEASPQAGLLVTLLAVGPGGYGLMRLGYGLAPEVVSQRWCILLVGILGIATLLHGVLCALAQTDLRRRFAYLLISQLGWVLLGLAALTSTALQGTMLQLCALALSGSLLALLPGLIAERTGEHDLERLGGLGRRMPLGSGLALVVLLALMGLPGLSHFLAELQVLMGSWGSYEEAQALGPDLAHLPRGLVVLALPGLLLTAACLLLTIEKVFLGEAHPPDRPEIRDLSLREILALGPLALITLLLGLWPAPLLALLEPAAQGLLSLVHRW